jgi:hypothetical protein
MQHRTLQMAASHHKVKNISVNVKMNARDNGENDVMVSIAME